MLYTTIRQRRRPNINQQRFVSEKRTTWLRRLQRAVRFPGYPTAPARFGPLAKRNAEPNASLAATVSNTNAARQWPTKSYQLIDLPRVKRGSRTSRRPLFDSGPARPRFVPYPAVSTQSRYTQFLQVTTSNQRGAQPGRLSFSDYSGRSFDTYRPMTSWIRRLSSNKRIALPRRETSPPSTSLGPTKAVSDLRQVESRQMETRLPRSEASWTDISFAPSPIYNEHEALPFKIESLPPAASDTMNKEGGTQSNKAPVVTLHLDGASLGRWAVDHLGRVLSRPAAGMTGVDPRIGIPKSRVSPF